MTEIRSQLPPVRRQIVVRGDPHTAFAVWTEEIALWWPADGSIFDHPDVPEHVAFLRRLHADGVLVAAGPFAGTAAGMAVPRAPNGDRAAEYARLAAKEDQSVVRGLLDVDVRTWRVMFTG